MFISDTTLAVAIDDVKRGLWFLCHCFMRVSAPFLYSIFLLLCNLRDTLRFFWTFPSIFDNLTG